MGRKGEARPGVLKIVIVDWVSQEQLKKRKVSIWKNKHPASKCALNKVPSNSTKKLEAGLCDSKDNTVVLFQVQQ
jgi:hypothetical protein